jgi:hypothetical protein
MTFGLKVLKFYQSIDFSRKAIPDQIVVMNPLKDRQVLDLNRLFYGKYYNDNRKRIFLIGINPGRFGGGITGIPFTDPIHLDEILKINHSLPKKHELSSRFIYEVIKAIGGPEVFFGKCYLTAVSPLGFMINGKNVNYYDHKALLASYENQFADWLKEQIGFGANLEIAFSLGKGKNFDFLKKLNKKYELFNRMEALPHPRWVMQYRYPKRDKYVRLYCDLISRHSVS